jgi:hypothetical protein
MKNPFNWQLGPDDELIIETKSGKLVVTWTETAPPSHRLRSELRLIKPYVNLAGDMCGLCDGKTYHEHPMSECCHCKQTGLLENMEKHVCRTMTPNGKDLRCSV